MTFYASTQSPTHTWNDSHNREITRPCSTTIFVRNGLTVDNASVSENDNIEILSIELMGISVSSVYKPSIETFILPNAVTDGRVNVVIGDLNSHSVTWGYGETNEDGESVENWADANQMSLIHDAKLHCSFNSCRWRRGYHPDLMFVSNNIANQCEKVVLDPIPHYQHWPIGIRVNVVITPRAVPFRRRFDLK